MCSPTSWRPSAPRWSTPRKSSASAPRTRWGHPRTGSGRPNGTITGASRRGNTPRAPNSVSVRSPSDRLHRMARPTRRVVTGHDVSGKAVALIDGAAPNAKLRKATGLTSTLLWVTDRSPADNSGSTDAAEREIGVAPPPRGSIFRVVDFPPAAEFGSVDNAAMLREMGIGAGAGGARHAGMHRPQR